MIRTANNRSVQAAGNAGMTMRGAAGRFGKDFLNYISLSAQPLLLRRENGRNVVNLTDCSGANPAIGIRINGSAGLKTTKVPMNKGDMMLIFTPGIIGLESPSGESLGIEKLSAALAGTKAERAESVLADITEMLKKFCEKDAVPSPLQMLLLRRR
jgi:serine phosphatase RsbU (regulator of sigma subunit)